MARVLVGKTRDGHLGLNLTTGEETIEGGVRMLKTIFIKSKGMQKINISQRSDEDEHLERVREKRKGR